MVSADGEGQLSTYSGLCVVRGVKMLWDLQGVLEPPAPVPFLPSQDLKL
jgi:hypothetical protein